jgi:hypothetical protein
MLAATWPVLALAACATAAGHTEHADARAHVFEDAPDNNNDGPPVIDAPPDAPPDAPSGSCAMPFSGVLATWTFTGAAGNQATTAAASTAPGVTAGGISRSTGLNAVSGAGSINSSGWPTATALNPNFYYTFSVTPPAGCAMDLTQLAIDAKASSSGPAMSSVATNADSFAATTAVSTTAPSTPALAVSSSTASVEIRVYGFHAGSASGTFRVQNTLTVTGALH